jgi:hypothetical protein
LQAPCETLRNDLGNLPGPAGNAFPRDSTDPRSRHGVARQRVRPPPRYDQVRRVPQLLPGYASTPQTTP